jgi:hypothetical protein
MDKSAQKVFDRADIVRDVRLRDLSSKWNLSVEGKAAPGPF